MFSTFSEAFSYIKRFTNYEVQKKIPKRTAFKLERMEKLLNLLGNPHLEIKCVHIAGTKGKGSTAIALAKILSDAGYKVGLYTSPHLVDVRERIKVNGVNISRKDFVHLTNLMLPHIKKLRPTFFEIITSMAFILFNLKKVDFAVIETGLGGRLDATNVIRPVLSIITKIDYDHTDVLGRRLEEIAKEKAGIIKPGTPVILTATSPAVIRVVRQKAHEVRAPLYILNKDFHYRVWDKQKLYMDFVDSTTSIKGICTNLVGGHFAENLSGVIKAINLLVPGNKINIKRALWDLKFPARNEIISTMPIRMIDCSHNPGSISALRRALEKLRYKNLFLVFGANADKDIKGMLRIILPVVDVAIFTKANFPRAADVEYMVDIALSCEKRSGLIIKTQTVKEAIKISERMLTSDDMLVVCGSFYVAGEAIIYYKKIGLYATKI